MGFITKFKDYTTHKEKSSTDIESVSNRLNKLCLTNVYFPINFHHENCSEAFRTCNFIKLTDFLYLKYVMPYFKLDEVVSQLELTQ